MSVLFDMCLFFTAFLSVCYFYVFSQQEIKRPVLDRFLFLPAVLAIGIGMCINNTKAVMEGFFGVQSPFTRTPKYNVLGRGQDWQKKRYRGTRSILPLLELLMAAYFCYIIYFALTNELFTIIIFLSLFLTGYLYVGLMSLFQRGFIKELRTLIRPA